MSRLAPWIVWLAACATTPPPPTYAPPPSAALPAYAMAPAGHVPPPSTVPPPVNAAPPHAPPATYGVGYSPTRAARERGKASYYHDSLAGNRTASGEVYDPSQVSAAHRTLPFGSVVDVVRADGRWVRVRVNDRGPFAKGRIIDLSRRAAEQLGIIEAGVADVTLYVVASPTR